MPDMPGFCTEEAANTPITVPAAGRYVMLDLKRRAQDVADFVAALESVIIATLDSMNVKGERREDRVGVWVRRPEKPAAHGRHDGGGQDSGNRIRLAQMGELSRIVVERRSGP